MPRLQGTPVNIRMNLILPKLGSWGYVFVADGMGLSLFKFLWLATKTHVFWNRMCSGRSRSSEIVDFRINRKHLCDFLLNISSNLCPILPRLRDIAGFLFRTATPPLFHPNFGGVSVGPFVLDCHCQLFIPVMELVQPICSRYLNIRDRWMDDLQ